jgi:ubiquinone/menaquinone biosynthesis C-methylase UbiE
MSSAAERFLIDFHARLPGATGRAIADVAVRCAGRVFASSYELLAEQVPASAKRVLDVACGDGVLIALIARRCPGARLTGIDMSAAELAAARARLQGQAELVECRAQELPFADGSFDAITSHMALMLMDDVSAVLRELRRVAQRGARFSAVVGAGFPASPAMQRYRELLNPHLAASATRVAIGDARWREAEGPRALLQEAGFDGVTIDPVEGELRLPPSDLWDWFMLTYDAHFVDSRALAAIREQYLASMGPAADADGRIGLPVSWRLVQATA